MGESDENHSSCVSDWQCTKHEFMNSPLEAEFPCSAAAFRKSSLNPCSTRSCAAEHWSMSCLQLCHVPRGSASPGTKMFLTCSKHVYMMATQKRLMTIAEYEHIYSNEVLSVITCHESYAALRMNRGVCICFTSFWGKKHCIEATCIREICYLGHRCIMVLLEIYILLVLEILLKCTKKVNSSLNHVL